MAGVIIGGFYVKTLEATRSWGIEPASASGTGVVQSGGNPTFGAGDYVSYSIMGVSFYGICSSMERLRSIAEGDEWAFALVDNRIRLRWAVVFGQWNMEEDPSERLGDHPPEQVSTLDEYSGGEVGLDNGVDFVRGVESEMGSPRPLISYGTGKVKRMFRHIHPAHWRAQISTYTEIPHTAAKILQEAVKGSKGGASLGLNLHTALYKPSFEVDANSGMSLAALVSQIADAAGLQVTLDGTGTLRFDRRNKGGDVQIPANSHVRRLGKAISSDPTKVRVVGGARLIQVNNIELLPDWADGYEYHYNEHIWLEEVERIMADSGPQQFGTAAYYAEVAAYARTITLREYVDWKGPGTFLFRFDDPGYWRGVKRMDLPVWTYLREIVFRSYRATSHAETNQLVGDLFGIPMSSMELHEGLICDCNIDTSSDDEPIRYSEHDAALYPGGAAFIAVKGQPLDILDSMVADGMCAGNMDNSRDKWSNVNDFTLDPKRMSVHFTRPVFKDGGVDDREDRYLLRYPNRSGGVASGEPLEGLADDSPYADIVVPNPDYKIAGAKVFASFVFKVGIFYRDFGSGAKWTSYHAPGIAEHLLVAGDTAPAHTQEYDGDTGVPTPPDGGFLEVLYENGGTAKEAAEEASAGMIVRTGLEESGEFVRIGAAGTHLTKGIDRITTRLTREDGLVEVVEFAKPRPSRGFRSSKEIAERVKNEELFDGQRELKKDVEYLRAISKLNRQAANRSPASAGRTYNSISDVLGKSAGNSSSDARQLPNPSQVFPEGANSWKAGDLVWLDKEGNVSLSGRLFGGVCVIDSAGNFVNAERVGIVPTAVQPGTQPGPVMAKPGDWKTSPDGTHPIGMLNHAEKVPGDPESKEAILALVRLGTPAKRSGRFIVTFDSEKQELLISPGAVGRLNYFDPSYVVPSFPKVGDAILDQERPISIDGKEAGTAYEVRLVFGEGALVEISDPAEEDEEEEDEEEEDPPPYLVIANVTFKAASDAPAAGLTIDSLEQLWESDVLWPEGDASGSSSSGSSSSGSSGSGSSDSGSSSWDASSGDASSSAPSGESSAGSTEKSSNAIVPLASRESGFAALATIESNQVLFEFVLRDLYITGKETRVPIHPDHLAVCEPQSMTVVGAPCCTTPHTVGVEVVGNEVILRASRYPWQRPEKVSLRLTGIRKGFGQWDMPSRTLEQFNQNEESLKAMYKR